MGVMPAMGGGQGRDVRASLRDLSGVLPAGGQIDPFHK